MTTLLHPADSPRLDQPHRPTPLFSELRSRRVLACGLALLVCSAACSRIDQGRLTDDQRRALDTSFPYPTLDDVLAEHVDSAGRVDYAALKANPQALRSFAAALAETGPTSRPELFASLDHQVAYYMNAYNSLAILNVLPRYPELTDLDSFSSKADFFKFTKSTVDGESASLDHLEHGIIRPALGELYAQSGQGRKFGRIHFALNCVSASCPVLPAEAFTPEKVDAQLEREARRFVMEERNVKADASTKTVWLSKIFEWFEEDLWDDAGNPIPTLQWINHYRPDDQQIDPSYAIAYRDYNWTLNAQTIERPGVTVPLEP
ncbi:MAG: DUF547 domain-containing protein [Myxococcota bacterium]